MHFFAPAAQCFAGALTHLCVLQAWCRNVSKVQATLSHYRCLARTARIPVRQVRANPHDVNHASVSATLACVLMSFLICAVAVLDPPGKRARNEGADAVDTPLAQSTGVWCFPQVLLLLNEHTECVLSYAHCSLMHLLQSYQCPLQHTILTVTPTMWIPRVTHPLGFLRPTVNRICVRSFSFTTVGHST